MAKHHNSQDVADPWQPWQLRAWFIVPLVAVALAVFASLEALVQIGNRPLDETYMRSLWLEWYCRGAANTTCIDTSLLSNLSFYRTTSDDSRSGFLTFLIPDEISPLSSFGWLYLPTMLAVAYAVFWQVVDQETKRIEPLYQAQCSSGATAASTLFASYVPVPPFLVPLQALRWRQMGVCLSSLTYVLVGFITPILQSQMFQIQNQVIQVGVLHRNGPNNATFEVIERGGSFESGSELMGVFSADPVMMHLPVDNNVPGLSNQAKLRNVVYLDPVYARAQEVILLLAAVTGSMLLYWTSSRNMTLRNSQKGLGSLASLAAPHADFLAEMACLAEAQDLRESQDIERRLGQRVLHLGSKPGNDLRYGFWFEDVTPETPKEQHSNNPMSALKRRWNQQPYLTLRWATLLCFVSSIYLAYAEGKRGGFTFNKQTPSPVERYEKTISRDDVVVTSMVNLVLVSTVKSLWVVVEDHITSLSLFRSLARRPRAAFPAFARDYTSTGAVMRVYHACQDGQALLALVSVVSLLLEVGLTCFGIEASMNDGQGYNASTMHVIHWVGFPICIFIACFTCYTACCVVVGYMVVCRSPDTLGARISYFCKSPQLLGDFSPLQVMNDAEKQVYLGSVGHKYSLAVRCGESREGQPIRFQSVERLAEV